MCSAYAQTNGQKLHDPKRKLAHGLAVVLLGGEPASEATSISTVLTKFSVSPLLFTEWQFKEVIHVLMSISYECCIDSMINYKKETMLLTCLADKP
ncbi:hypothetical protein QQP08_009763 [Theobroma cacao]|nr:hypothetical protein QQP08_009763 [Theobroma cacao]